MTLSEAHHRHLATLGDRPAHVDEEGLRIGDQYVMFFAEADLMRQHVTHLVAGLRRPDVLEVGLGLGVFAEQLLDLAIGSYTAIEPHPGVVRLAQDRVLWRFNEPATVITRPWQEVVLPADAFDLIMYDTWPPEGYADADFDLFVRQVAVSCLRPGGRFSFFHSGDTLNAARRAVLDRNFAKWITYPYTLPVAGTPASWTKPTRDFLIPIATKGDHQHDHLAHDDRRPAAEL